jgi:hypothetical protein
MMTTFILENIVYHDVAIAPELAARVGGRAPGGMSGDNCNKSGKNHASLENWH